MLLQLVQGVQGVVTGRHCEFKNLLQVEVSLAAGGGSLSQGLNDVVVQDDCYAQETRPGGI